MRKLFKNLKLNASKSKLTSRIRSRETSWNLLLSGGCEWRIWNWVSNLGIRISCSSPKHYAQLCQRKYCCISEETDHASGLYKTKYCKWMVIVNAYLFLLRRPRLRLFQLNGTFLWGSITRTTYQQTSNRVTSPLLENATEWHLVGSR